MPKTKISDFSTTAGNNTDINSINIAEGCAPSGINDAIRTLMAYLKDWQSGAVAQDNSFNGAVTISGNAVLSANLTVAGTTAFNAITASTINNAVIGGSTPAAGTFTSLSDSGNLTFTGTGNRITGDFSNATVSSSVLFQSSTTNGATRVAAIPNGTGSTSALAAINNSNPTNAGWLQMSATSSEAQVQSTISGTGTYLPMTFYTNGSERMRLDTSGNLLFNSGYGSVATAYGCRAWVNFNGTGTVAIRASGNVTSITDNGTGDYTVNFTTALADANYSATALLNGGSGGNVMAPYTTTAPTTSAYRLGTRRTDTFNASDTEYVNVAFFR